MDQNNRVIRLNSQSLLLLNGLPSEDISSDIIGCILGLNLKKLSSQPTVRPSIQVHGSGGRFCEEIGRPCFFTQVDTEVKGWLFELQDDQRLNIALKAFKAIDKQMQIGADVREVVGQVLREIRTDFGSVKDAMDKSVKDYLKDIVAQAKASKEETENFIKQNIGDQTSHLVEKVELLLKQGKTIDEIEKELKTALSGLENAQSGLNTLLQTFKVSSVRGEKGELELLTMINEAFLTDKNILVKPLGGPDATDVMVKFCCQDLEIGDVLIESKATQTWSNDYLEQIKADMKRYGVATAILAVQKTPRGAKVRGYTIDDTLGIVVITTPEMAVSTLAMFYDIYLANYRLGRKTVNLQTIMDDKDILCHIQDNMECLNDCKKINDCVDKAHRDIHTHVSTIMNRLKENNEKIALILSKHGKTAQS